MEIWKNGISDARHRYCWYQCTVKGGREGRDLDAHALVVACEALGAGEVLLNCMDKVWMDRACFNYRYLINFPFYL